MRKYILTVILASVFGISAYCQSSATKYQALFMYNFTRYIEWPSSSSAGEFVIGVLGNGSITSDLTELTTGKFVGSQKITVKQFANISDISNCHLLFVNRSFINQFGDILTKFSGKNTLMVTDKPGMVEKGAGINFVIDDGKQRFEVNRNAIEKSGLKISSKLLDMAVAAN
ncbi:MAG: YfiR family protein [Bacteroidetes bacterium]|nr:YfiR family protein [Bacteroidales bacterium]NJO69538.1 YfiR family protein [Bacteroidota bacterium]